MTWDELQQLPDEVADEIELWDRKVIWNRRGPTEHQRFTRRICNAIESNAHRAMRSAAADGEQQCWVVEVETIVFFAATSPASSPQTSWFAGACHAEPTRLRPTSC